jgi:hypothetical protein
LHPLPWVFFFAHNKYQKKPQKKTQGNLFASPCAFVLLSTLFLSFLSITKITNIAAGINKLEVLERFVHTHPSARD